MTQRDKFSLSSWHVRVMAT